MINKDGFLDFTTYWTSLDGLQVYHTGSLRIKKSNSFAGPISKDNLEVYTTNLRHEYRKEEERRIRVFIRDLDASDKKAYKVPVALKSLAIDAVYYRVLDADSGKVIIDYGEDDNSTRLSSDSTGMYFDFFFSNLPIGRSYTIEYLIVNGNAREYFRDKNSRFLVV